MSRKRVIFVVLTAVLLSGLACQASAPQEEGDGQPGISPIPEAPRQVKEETAEDQVVVGQAAEEEGVCQGARWRIVPLAMHQYPAENGWKILVIPLAVENHSDLWGRISGQSYVWDAVVVSEDGYSYDIHSVNYIELPEDPSFPGFQSEIRILQLLPPGFSARGDTDYYQGVRSQLVFQVAESQNHFKLTISKLSLNCVTADGQNGWEQFEPIVLDLDTDLPVVSFPIVDAKAVVQGTSAPFEIGGASLQITSVYRDATWFGDEPDDLVVIEFQVTNLSDGYEASGIIRSYLIGDDGLIRFPGCGIPGCGPDFPSNAGTFHVGPGQTGEASIGFVAPRSVGNLKFVIADEREGVFWVSDLPDDL